MKLEKLKKATAAKSSIPVHFFKGKVKFARVHKPSPGYDGETLCWSILAEISEEAAEALEEKGFKSSFKQDEDGTIYVPLRKNLLKRDGSEALAPEVVDKFGKPVEKSIGNGSVCVVKALEIAYSHKKFGEGIKLMLDAVQVLDLVEYSVDRLSGFDIEEAPESSDDEDVDIDSEEF